ncbi:unnamed protein product [Staurois parvus]|uniref:Uncharacterized protein n=1 Tax=Staurois parvus TaxID=386267 RepID=A0ABN9GIC8_9NEOB|nr:unnamed protein product [Staurois parvus]
MTRDCGHSTGDDQRLQTFGDPDLTGTRSHFNGVVLPVVLWDTGQVPEDYSWVPTLKMPVSGREDDR